MSTFVLIPGAGGAASYWHRLVPELASRGHLAIPVGLPAGDDKAGWQEYADAVVAAVDGIDGPFVLVAQSMGGFTGPLLVGRLPVERLILLNAMVPLPGETGGAWWANTGQPEASAAFAAEQGREPDDDPRELLFHDVPPEVTERIFAEGEPVQSDTPFGQPWPLSAWPSVPIEFLQGTDDRLFPVAFQRRVVADRLGLTIDEMPGGHLVALSRPAEVADRLVAYARRGDRD
jgi:pimeloyl-ACP methyl ester carboxylesterase